MHSLEVLDAVPRRVLNLLALLAALLLTPIVAVGAHRYQEGRRRRARARLQLGVLSTRAPSPLRHRRTPAEIQADVDATSAQVRELAARRLGEPVAVHPDMPSVRKDVRHVR